MAKKIIKKRKLKISNFLLLILIILIITIGGYFVVTSKIKNIIIIGNHYILDEDVIKTAGIEDYPSFFLTFSYKMKEDIKKIPLVKDVKIKKGFFNKITINIEEYDILLKNGISNLYILSNGKEIEYKKNIRVPRLTNNVDEEKYKSLVSNLKDVDKEILGRISEIQYVPNEYDKDRFLLYMDDDNTVYLTLTKFDMINYYNDVLSQLEGRKGILYLDSGNHFKIMQ